MIVEVEQGKLEGLTKTSIFTGKDYYAFLGIPYAKPPVGKLRFQPPQPIEKWDGILNAEKEGPPCIQPRFSGGFNGSEDCLYLNVYTPSPMTDAALKAVIVCIPGGAFLTGSGSSNLYSPDYLIGYDVIIVTINYRLHALGFLNMGTKNSADNCGLRDQLLALKWVNENIQNFGGDPKHITLFGNSAGGTCVYYHMISPKSKGLFHQAIIHSDPVGCFLDDHRYDSRQMGFDLARRLGFEDDDPEKLIEFLRSQSVEEITKNVPNVDDRKRKNKSNTAIMFHPYIDVAKDDAFLPDTIENLRKTATPIPLIIGINSKEGRMAFAVVSNNLVEMAQDGVSRIIKRPHNMNDLDFQLMCDRIERQYLDEPMDGKTVEKLADVFTDYWYRKLYESIDFIVKSDLPVYLYEFNFFGKFNIFEKSHFKRCLSSSSGAGHADELPYLFYPKILLPNLTEFGEPETTVIKNMCSLWTNFVKTSNPTENFGGFEWRRFTSKKPCFLRMNTDLKLIERKLREKEFAFWNELLQ